MLLKDQCASGGNGAPSFLCCVVGLIAQGWGHRRWGDVLGAIPPVRWGLASFDGAAPKLGSGGFFEERERSGVGFVPLRPVTFAAEMRSRLFRSVGLPDPSR